MTDKPNLLIVTEAFCKYPQGVPPGVSDQERALDAKKINGVYRTYENFSPWLKAHFNVHFLTPYDFPGEERGLWAILKPDTPFTSPFKERHRLVHPSDRSMNSIMQAIRPDHVHIATEMPLGLSSMLWCKRSETPVSTAFHTNFHTYAADYTKGIPLPESLKIAAVKKYLRWFHGQADASMAASEDLKGDLAASGFDPAKIHIVGRGIDSAIFRIYPDDTRPLREEFALSVGRISPSKDVEVFCALDTHGLKKVVVGTGTLEEKMKADFPDVHFAGFKEGQELAKYYSAAKVFVMPSTSETFGITVIEAGGCGAPVVARNEGFHQSILKTHPGLGITRGNLQQAFDEAIGNPGQFLPRGEIAAHTAATWTWPKAADQFTAMVESARRKTGRPSLLRP